MTPARRGQRPPGSRRGVHRLWLGAALCLSVALLSACTRTPFGGEGVGVFSGVVENYRSGSAELRATAVVFDGVFGSEIDIGQGNIRADGVFSFSFEPRVRADALIPLFSADNLCDGVTVSDRGVRGGTIYSLDVVGAGGVLGVIGLAASEAHLSALLLGTDPPAGHVGARLYVNGPVTVDGTCNDGLNRYELTLVEGWNLVEFEYDGEGAVALRSVMTARGNWRFLLRQNTGSIDTTGQLLSIDGSLRRQR